MFKVVMSAVLAATAMVGFSGAAHATDVPDKFVGTWKEEYKDIQPGFSCLWTISSDGKVYVGEVDLKNPPAQLASAGDVEKIEGSEITFLFKYANENGGVYEGAIKFDRLTNVGEVKFTNAPDNSPKKTQPGPYSIKMKKQ